MKLWGAAGNVRLLQTPRSTAAPSADRCTQGAARFATLPKLGVSCLETRSAAFGPRAWEDGFLRRARAPGPLANPKTARARVQV